MARSVSQECLSVLCVCCIVLWRRQQAKSARAREARRQLEEDEAELQKGFSISNPRLRLLVERVECT